MGRGAILFGLGLGAVALLAAAARPTHHENTFADGDELELRVHLSTLPRFSAFNDTSSLVWQEAGFTYSAGFAEKTKTIQVPVTATMLSNGSLFAHVFVTKVGASPDPHHGDYDRWAFTSATHELVTWGERLKPMGLHNLITGERAPWEVELDRGVAETADEAQYISYWIPAVHTQLLHEAFAHPVGEMPALTWNYLHHHRLVQAHRYKPLLYINELTVMKSHWLAINATSTTLPLELTIKPLPARRFQWMVNLQHSFKMNEETLGISEKESEDMRGMFVNTNPVLLYTTVAVSTVHMLFDMLAFKNDVSFWNSVETMEGLSSRSLILNQIMEAVILLYLFEEDASWLVKFGSTLTLTLGLFKIIKSLRVKKADAAKTDGRASLTDEIDRLAFRYLSPPLLLLVVAYSGHSLYTGYYKGWYAWLIESLVALVYGGGFIVMTPQLFINYRLKSVAHLPWKFFMYKALNTFIDDLFAFIIKMPTLHRMSCFRDDIVFVVFLYQRHAYKTDMSRVNEFGHTGDKADEPEPNAAGKKAAGKTDGSAVESAGKRKKTKKEQ